jgi:hypothetical protein
VMKITGSSLDDWIYYHLSYTFSLTYNKYSATADLHNLQFIVVHTLGFTVSTIHLLATDLNTETNASNHYEAFLLFHLQSLCTPLS